MKSEKMEFTHICRPLFVFGVFLILTSGQAQETIIEINASQTIHPQSRHLTGACIEDVNHEVYGGIYSQMIFGESLQEPGKETGSGEISGMWQAVHRGSAAGEFAIERQNPFAGAQSQRMSFTGGVGEIGIANQGLNHWGLNFIKHREYEGYVWVRANGPTELFVVLESGNSDAFYAEKKLTVKANGDWQRLDFKLTPNQSDTDGRFIIKLKQAGSITIGHAFLQPGGWGRFKNLPVRKDVAEGLINQGITVLRYGGSMVNAPEYRWKKMIGPRDRRPPYTGTWYPQSSNGWGIFDFLNFCEAAGFLGVPDLNAGETPQDMADFVEYVNGPASSEWGRKRAADGHPEPYRLKYVEIGNEESVNDAYYEKFKPVADAIWAKDPGMIPVVGDFVYHRPIQDPFNFTGADGRITSLAIQQRIMQLAKQHNAEVWFDVHMGTEGPRPDFGGTLTYIDALDQVADGARHHVVIFELNANNHSQRRALANAAAINTVERDGRLPIVTSANCLQPDGQNDNGWDQGLLFLNPSQVWLQPPGYVTRMISNNYQPLEVKAEVHGGGNNLDVSAKRSEDNHTLVLQTVNFSAQPVTATILLHDFVPAHTSAQVEELTGALNADNPAIAPERVKPYSFAWRPEWKDGKTPYTFPPQSFTVIRFN